MALIVGLVLGYLAGASWGGPETDLGGEEQAAAVNLAESENGEAAAVPTGAPGSAATIAIAGQTAGPTVTVGSVSINVPTWVSVREDENGRPGGSILGAKLLSEGTVHQNVVVELLVPTLSGAKYHVNLYADNGDRLFDHREDQLIKGESGAVIDALFSVS